MFKNSISTLSDCNTLCHNTDWCTNIAYRSSGNYCHMYAFGCTRKVDSDSDWIFYTSVTEVDIISPTTFLSYDFNKMLELSSGT